MKLFLIKTERDIYSTNADDENQALNKFKEEYPEYDVLGYQEIEVEALVRLEDNDDIIFF
jgi:hypothetical protein